MLLPLVLLLQKPADGLQRFHDFIQKTKSFSVQITDHSIALTEVGKGSLLVQRPGSFRLRMAWGTDDYTYVKNTEGSVDYVRSMKSYEEYPASPGISPNQSVLGGLQGESMPLELVSGSLQAELPRSLAYKLTSQDKGSDTYTATWADTRTKGNLVATIDPAGKLVHFDATISSQTGTTHRTMDFTDYVANPPLARDSFNTEPPVGYTAYLFPDVEPTILVGDKLSLGKWKSRAGISDIDSDVRGKLLIVRAPNSPPADSLLAYLAKKKLPVRTFVVSIGSSGGQFWAPSPKIADKLSAIGTPLIILLDSSNKVKGIWLGFDSDNPGNLVSEIVAAKERTGE